MTSILRQFRGLAIALAVLAISAGAVFAAAPSLTLTASHNRDQATTAQGLTVDASESAEPSDSAEPSESVEPSESPDPSESVAPSQSPDASGSPAPSESASPDNHGALVSTAARMPTPSGFPNHGAFVSCVAHLDASAQGFDWSTVTPESCGIAQPSASADTKQHGKSQAGTHGQSGKSHGQGQGQGQGHGRPSTGG
jgi:hypothetical protein